MGLGLWLALDANRVATWAVLRGTGPSWEREANRAWVFRYSWRRTRQAGAEMVRWSGAVRRLSNGPELTYDVGAWMWSAGTHQAGNKDDRLVQVLLKEKALCKEQQAIRAFKRASHWALRDEDRLAVVGPLLLA